jgi:hypothetical protein
MKPDDTPRYPILISLAAEAISDDMVVPLRGYVSAGGFLFAGSSSFTRYPDGRTRGDFALAAEMGVHMASASLRNWYVNGSFVRLVNQRLTAHIPAGTNNWRLPMNSEEIPWGIYPDYPPHWEHLAWQVNAGGAQVLANGSSGPLLTINNYGGGEVIYYGLLQPLIGHGGFDVGMYNYVILRQAIEWAFEAREVPVVKLSPWQYEYDSAFTVRHDLENIGSLIITIDQSAQYEYQNGAKGDYYFTTGTLRQGSEDDMLNEQQKANGIAGLRTAVTQYGATIGSHNGGLDNPATNSLSPTSYEYWHWGPDEALDTTQPGYSSGGAYARASILQSYQDIEGWLDGVDNGRAGCGAVSNCPRIWVSPFFNSTREESHQILEDLGAVTLGEQKLTVFPHWTVSTQVDGKRFKHLNLPTSEWYVDDIVQSLDGHTTESLDEAVDFYYALGALVNIYSHNNSDQDSMTQHYILRVGTKPRMWSTNAVGVYDWWVRRSGVSVTPSYTLDGTSASARALVSGSSDPQAAVEMVLPGWGSGEITNLQVFLNGVPAGSGSYRTTSYGVKVKVGTTVREVEVRFNIGTGATATAAPGSTSTSTPTSTRTSTPTQTRTATTTSTLTPTHTRTQTTTPTSTLTRTPTASATQTNTVTPTSTATATSPMTATSTATSTSSPTITHTATPTSISQAYVYLVFVSRAEPILSKPRAEHRR